MNLRAAAFLADENIHPDVAAHLSATSCPTTSATRTSAIGPTAPATATPRANSDRPNARIEHDKALSRVIVSLMQDDMKLFKQFSANDAFRRWMTDTVFDLIYEAGTAATRLGPAFTSPQPADRPTDASTGIATS